MPLAIPDSTFDIGEMLRQKRIRDILQIQRGSSVDPSAPSQIPTVDSQAAPTAAPVAPAMQPSVASSPQAGSQVTGNVAAPDPSLYQVPSSTEALRQKIQQAPDLGKYKPSLFRRILGGAAGMGATIESGNPAAGEAARASVVNAPFNRQNEVYEQQLGNVKALSSIDQSIEAAKEKARMDAATRGHLGAQSEAEVERAKAETARRIHEETQTAAGPKTFEDTLKLEASKHPETAAPYRVELDKERGVYILTNQKTGEVTPTPYGDPKEIADKLPGELGQLAAAQKIKADPNETPERKAAATSFLKEYAIRGQEKPAHSLMMIPDGKGGYTSRDVGPGQSIPAGAVTSAGLSSEAVTSDKQIQQEREAKKKAGETYQTAQRLVNQAESAKDPSTAATADAALVMQLAGAIKPDALGKLRWNQSEQDFLIKKTRSLGGDVEALASKAAGGEHVILTSQQRKAFLETMKNIAAGPESLQQAPSGGDVIRWEKGPDGKPRKVAP